MNKPKMAATATGKMSLLAQFDDLCRYTDMLTGSCEQEFLQFVKLVKQFRRQWLQTESVYKELQMEHETALIELKEWKTNYDNLRKQYREEQKGRLAAEQKMADMNNILGEVKEVVNRDTTLANQTKERFMQFARYEPALPNIDFKENKLVEQSVLYDKTEDDIELQDEDDSPPNRSGKRKSGNRKSGSTPPKRIKSGENLMQSETLVATATVTIPQGRDNIVATSTVTTYSPPTQQQYRHHDRQTPQQKDHRSNSEPDPISTPVIIPAQASVTRTNSSTVRPERFTSSSSLPAEIGTPRRITPIHNNNGVPFRTHLSGSKLNTRVHHFVSKTVIRPETCLPCGRRIKFYKEAFKCQDCRATCHPECQSTVPLPCVPCAMTPKNKTDRATVADFAPMTAPMIPALIIHCINEIERRGMSEVGLYRVPGSEREVRELKEKILKGKGQPNLSNIDVHVLCGVIKDFLRSFETLIPRTLWQEFIKAAETDDDQDCLTSLYQAISQLAQPNRDTLAYIMMHLQRISETPDIKMNVHNLSTVLGPTIVGYSSANLAPEQLMMEQRKQCLVVQKLLGISSDYWSSFINVELENNMYSTLSRGNSTRTTPESMLGPVRMGSFTRSGNRLHVSATPISHRNRQDRVFRPRAQKKFFASPKLQN